MSLCIPPQAEPGDLNELLFPGDVRQRRNLPLLVYCRWLSPSMCHTYSPSQFSTFRACPTGSYTGLGLERAIMRLIIALRHAADCPRKESCSKGHIFERDIPEEYYQVIANPSFCPQHNGMHSSRNVLHRYVLYVYAGRCK